MQAFRTAQDHRAGAVVRWALLAGFVLTGAGGCAETAARRSGTGAAPDLALARDANAASGHSRIDLAALPQPRPEYKPHQVVQIVMDALQNNDPTNAGIAVAFNFTSPENRRATGPLERFIALVQRPVYGPLLNCSDVAYGTATVDGDHAVEIVAVRDATGDPAFYAVQLSRQLDGQYQGCWMTDGVLRIAVEPGRGASRSHGVVRI